MRGRCRLPVSFAPEPTPLARFTGCPTCKAKAARRAGGALGVRGIARAPRDRVAGSTSHAIQHKKGSRQVPQLPDIAPQQAQRLNAGPRHARGSAFSNHNYNRLYRDNTLTAETRHSGRRDKVAEERELRRKKARQEQERARTEKRLKTLERRMRDEAKRIAAMERELKELPKLKKTRQQLAHEWAHMEDSPRTSRSAETGRDEVSSSPRSESAPARSSPLYRTSTVPL